MQLKTQTAVITGASTGIGRAIALAFAQQGANLILHAKSNQDQLSETVALVQEYGANCTTYLADLTCPESRENFVQAVLASGLINIWVNNAGADILTNVNSDLNFSEKLCIFIELLCAFELVILVIEERIL